MIAVLEMSIIGTVMNTDNMRILLFLLLLVAILLIIAGAVIALWTLNSYRKSKSGR
jgi:uncharacterized SAM-binding protein YcdF (DUF218 family)